MSSPWFARLPGLHPHLLPVWCSLTHLADPVWPDHVNLTIKFSKYCTVDNSNSPQLSVLQNYWNVSPSFLRSWFHLDSQIEASYTRGNTCVTMCTYRPVTSPSCLRLGTTLGCVLKQRPQFCCVSQNNVEHCCWLLAAVKDAILLTRTYSLTASDLPCRGLVLLVITKSTMKLDSR